MENEFVDYNLALRMKALGFDEPCLVYFNNKSKELLFLNERDISFLQGTSNTTFTKSPTWQSAFAWFRENHNLIGFIEIGTIEYSFRIMDATKVSSTPFHSFNGNYEEAQQACLEKLIEIVEETK